MPKVSEFKACINRLALLVAAALYPENPADTVDWVEPISAKLRNYGPFRALPPAFQAAMFVNGTNLSHVKGAKFVENDIGFDPMTLFDIPHPASFFVNYNPDPQALLQNLTRATEQWQEKSGWAGPRRLGEGEGVAHEE